MIATRCLQCHGPGGKAARVPLVQLSDFLDSPLDLVVPGNAAESDLIMVLENDAKKKMPPLDARLRPVSSDQREIIKVWINNGAKD